MAGTHDVRDHIFPLVFSLAVGLAGLFFSASDQGLSLVRAAGQPIGERIDSVIMGIHERAGSPPVQFGRVGRAAGRLMVSSGPPGKWWLQGYGANVVTVFLRLFVGWLALGGLVGTVEATRNLIRLTRGFAPPSS